MKRIVTVWLVVVASALHLFVAPSALSQGVDNLITGDGAGLVQLDMSVSDLRAQLPPEFELSERVDIESSVSGFVLTRAGVLQMLIVAPETSSAQVQQIVVVSRNYRTADGIGPGSELTSAEARLGQASLQWDPDDDGKETVTFANAPAGMVVRTSDFGGPRAGTYAGEDLATNVYKPEAVVSSVVVVGCGGPCSTGLAASVAAPPAPANAVPINAAPTITASTADDGTELPKTGATTTISAIAGFTLLGAGSLVLAGNRRRDGVGPKPTAGRVASVRPRIVSLNSQELPITSTGVVREIRIVLDEGRGSTEVLVQVSERVHGDAAVEVTASHIALPTHIPSRTADL